MKSSTKVKVMLITLFAGSFLAIQCTKNVTNNNNGSSTNTDNNQQNLGKSNIQLPAPVISAVIPAEVVIGSGVTSPEQARPFFDYFSWQSFAAINWPAAIGADGNPVRGTPNTNAGVGIGSPGGRVWESYKADWELFVPYGSEPTAWSSWDTSSPKSTNPCTADPGARTLMMISKMDSVLDETDEAFSSPLVDQNRNYVRYEIVINQTFYDSVVGKKWYILANQPTDPNNPAALPNGVIEIKAAWKELVEGKDDPGRFYAIDAQIVEPGPTPSCRKAKMGLVGLHIANKVDHFREWVWSTFEQVDNVPDTLPPHGGKYSFNNGTSTPASPKGFDHQPAKPDPKKPFPPPSDPARNPVQVTRVTPISQLGQPNPTTDQINAQWQQALAGTVWQFYKLVATQWPTVIDGANFKVRNDDGGTGVLPFNADTPFPAENVVNTTMETYFQASTPGKSCMECHYSASQQDFSWILALKPQPPPNSLGDSESSKAGNNLNNRRAVLRNILNAISKNQ